MYRKAYRVMAMGACANKVQNAGSPVDVLILQVGDTGNRCDLLPDQLDIRSARFTRLEAAPLGRVLDVQRDADLHDVGGIVAEGHLREPQKAADGIEIGRGGVWLELTEEQ